LLDTMSPSAISDVSPLAHSIEGAPSITSDGGFAATLLGGALTEKRSVKGRVILAWPPPAIDAGSISPSFVESV
jgi:hypothetical protein